MHIVVAAASIARDAAQGVAMPTPFPARLHVEVTTRCNLRCPMCVKQTPGCRIDEGDLPYEHFVRLQSVLPAVQSLVLNGIGEPLLHPDLAAMLRFARAHMPADASIGFQTNGQLLTPALAQEVVQAGVDRICFSVDGLDDAPAAPNAITVPAALNAPAAPAAQSAPDVPSVPAAPATPALFAPASHHPASMGHGEGHAARLAGLMALLRDVPSPRPGGVQLGCEYVFMRDNAHQLPQMVRWAAQQGARFMLVSHVLPYDASMAHQSLFVPDTEEALAFMRVKHAEAAAQGLHLGDYFDVLWKFYKTDAEKALVAFVGTMQEQAVAQGISLHLRRLLGKGSVGGGKAYGGPALDPAAVAHLFAAAQAEADVAGMELSLPQMGPRLTRRCEFVEEGAAFIAADGGVYPCQFLWHRYACFLDGEVKQVFPRCFGTLAEHTLEQLWNGEAWRAFRAEVLSYRYPDCTNCPTVPCDDITGTYGEFDMDCHGVTVPCGHCPWCLGGVQCLG